MTRIAIKNSLITFKDGKAAEDCNCCKSKACACPQNCTIGMQFVSPSEADIGVCGPCCVPVDGVNPACPSVSRVTSDTGTADTTAGKTVITYKTSLNAVNDSTSFSNGVSKNVQWLFKPGLRESVYASLRYAFVYACDDAGARLPFLNVRAFLDMTHYEGFNISDAGFVVGGRSFSRGLNFQIDTTAYQCSSAEGRMCSNKSSLFNPTETQEFISGAAVFNFSQTSINGIPLVELESRQYGTQTRISQVYSQQFSSFTAQLVLSSRNECNPLP